jgi:MOSC domain-containing protein YiiM
VGAADDANVIRLASVNVGTPTVLGEIHGERVWSGIRKRSVAPTTVLWVSALNLAGDGQADLSVHGGVDNAVYAYPFEHLDPWPRNSPRSSAKRRSVRTSARSAPSNEMCASVTYSNGVRPCSK